MKYRVVSQPKSESPCKKCGWYPCPDIERVDCEARLAYVATFKGNDQMKAVQTDDDLGYSIVF